jgi:protoporphyrinogen oxidase
MLEKMDLISRDSVIFTRIWRQAFAYVVYDLEYQKNIKIIRDYCSTLGIPLVGRFAQFEYLNMDGCIRSAMDFISTYPRHP